MNHRSYEKPPVAPPANLTAVKTGSLPVVGLESTCRKPLPASRQLQAASRAGDFHHALGLTDGLDLRDIRQLSPASPQDLVSEVVDAVRSNFDERQTTLAIGHATLAGVSEMMAFIGVSTELAANSSRVGREQIPVILRRSASALIELCRHTSPMDSDLTTALSTYSPKEIRSKSSEELFGSLTFDPAHFILSKENRVSIDYTSDLRTITGNKLDYSPNKRDIVLGCPFTSRVAGLFKAVTDLALNSGIVDTIYDEASKVG